MAQQRPISGHSYQMDKISGQFQDNFEISGIAGQLGPLILALYLWCRSASWYLAKSYKNGDQRGHVAQ